ncbi:hypothetical protein H4R20_006879 [Coemansia guatemalensis]|uniref:RPA43 OB domain-containing protein n=1 Tax=Coemansia guatemalensis TaxID=2761395 RepID=A0A9W8HRE8_9FUNG|nr:hypothetical protein H4R20_006879 [Coemansia guatemalensis]
MGEKRKSQQHADSPKKSKAQKPRRKDRKSSKIADVARAPITYPSSTEGSSFSECTARLTVTLAPVHGSDHWAGIHETLNSMLLHFVPQVRGVVLSYSKAKMLSHTALLFNDSPFGQLEISVKLLVWRPLSGMTLQGAINVQSPDHIGLLLWDTFNASIPASLIPKDKYEWRPFSDEEVAARALRNGSIANSAAEDQGDNIDDDAESVTASKEHSVGVLQDARFGSGEWVLKGTSQSVGSSGSLSFVVVDVIRADSVLSVTGALR